MSASAARTADLLDIGGYADGFEAADALDDGLAKSHPLGAGADGVRGVLDVGAVRPAAVLSEKRGSDAELAVGAVGRGLGGRGTLVEGLELGWGKPVLLRRRSRLRFVLDVVRLGSRHVDSAYFAT